MAHASLVDDSLEATADPHLTDAELRIVKESIKVVVENYNSEGRIPRAPGTTRKNLKNRLLLTMGRMKEYKVPATRWRKDKGRKVYLQVLKACPHLFLAFVAAVAPTVCHRLKDDNIQTLIQDNEVEPLRLRLNADAKDFLNSVATEGKFANDQRYLGLVSSLFPEVERLDCEGAGLLKSSAIRHDTEGRTNFSAEKHPSTEAEIQDERPHKRPRLSAMDTPGPVHFSNNNSVTNQSDSSHQSKDQLTNTTDNLSDRPLWNGNDTPFLELQTANFSNFLMKLHGEGGLLRLVMPRDGSPLPWIEVRAKEGDIITTMEISLESSTELIKFVRRESGYVS